MGDHNVAVVVLNQMIVYDSLDTYGSIQQSPFPASDPHSVQQEQLLTLNILLEKSQHSAVRVSSRMCELILAADR